MDKVSRNPLKAKKEAPDSFYMVGTGDVVRAGQAVGRVGHSGNASRPGHGRHVHFAFKRPGTGCGFDGVLVSENPYPQIRDARRRMGG